jgi:CRISPR-associated endonuclease/helicase Cas3
MLPSMNPSSLRFWAKLGVATWPEHYHPVVCHLIDVAAVARHMWVGAFRSRFRISVAENLSLDEDACGRWLAFWCGAHDIGKVAYCFQNRNDARTASLKERLRADGFALPSWDRPHGTISCAVLAEELASLGDDWPEVNKQLAWKVAVAVGGHHGLFPADWGDVVDLLQSAPSPCQWHKARREILGILARWLLPGTKAPQHARPDDQSVFMVLAGLTSVADWVGSNQEFFPPAGNSEVANGRFDLEGYFVLAQDRAFRALRQLGWLDREPPAARRSFDDLFRGILAGPPRPLQRAAEVIASSMVRPSLMLFEAPMGEGKTEAAWYVADTWDRGGSQGTYVALPTMATSNQMFDRVGAFLASNAGKKNLLLQHGKAALNDRFEQLRYAAEVYDREDRPSAVVAEGWFAANKKHGLLAPYGVGTIDQALLAVLQTKHVFVRLFGLAGKCVILDEVHAYDAYMTTLMERLLRWLAALGCPVVLLSATLPRDKRVRLLRAYAGDEMPDPRDADYPRITSVAVGGHADVAHVSADPGRAKTIALGWLSEKDLIETLRKSLAHGGCAAVIRNTVGLAQDSFLCLRDALKSDGILVELFHARFPFGRRMEIENAVLERFGKCGGAAERDRRVLVATQVVEQSLDLDFDLMVSDVAPVDLVLQRAGRLHRHGRGPRSDGVKEPRLWLIEPQTDDDQVPIFGVSGVVYSPHVLFRSLLALREKSDQARTTIELPGEIDGLINAVYEDTDPPESLTGPERAFWARSRDDHKTSVSKEEDEAESRRIRKPKHTGALARIVSVPREEDDPDLHPAHQALTRLSRPTVQLICLETGDVGSFRLIHNHSPIRTLVVRKMSAGGAEDVKQVLLGELITSHPGLVRELWGSPQRPKAWEDVGMLCHHHLITFVSGRAEVGNYELLVDNELGLQVVRTDDQGEDE